MNTYRFHFKIGFTILCLVFFILCCALGVWQLHRYQFKKNLLIVYQQQLNAEAKPLQQIIHSSNNLQFQPVKVNGKYKNELTLYIQNRFHHDQLGYEVVTPLQLPEENKLLLIDRGWIKKTNQLLPVIKAVAGPQNITGHIKELNEYQFILGKNILEPMARPLVAQKIDINELKQITHQDYYPFIIRLNASEENGFVRDWTMTTITPERHLGYAIQWFFMAFVLLIAYFCFCFTREI